MDNYTGPRGLVGPDTPSHPNRHVVTVQRKNVGRRIPSAFAAAAEVVGRVGGVVDLNLYLITECSIN